MISHRHSLIPDISAEDLRLVELAAKAAGVRLDPGTLTARGPNGHGYTYNPLDDDGQCFRLQVLRQVPVMHSDHYVVTHVGQSVSSEQITERVGDDRDKATRRAIVRAVAEHGKAMP